MKLEYKKMMKALVGVEEQKSIPEETILDALCEAMAKAYKKDAELNAKKINLPDIDVVAKINKKSKTIDLYQNYTVLESDDDVEDDALQIGLAEAKEIDPNAEVGGIVSMPVEVESLSRAAVSIAKNVMRQKLREAEKSAVYDEYKDKENEMVLGVVESVKDKFALVNLGKTVALMPHSAQIPLEILREGERIRVVITAVNKETKGSQVLVSRADPMLVRRLFEKEVPEIYNGTVEIKNIARDAGDRTKMAVLTHNPDIDPIGACIGPRGQRVQNIIDELGGEKIDIFEYSNDITELVKNALAPAEVVAVVPGEEENSLLVIVDSNQLSLAIGKKGKNARLAVKLTGNKIDIKTREELEEAGKDYDELMVQAEELKKKSQEKAAEAKKAAIAKAAQEDIEKKQAVLDKIAETRANAPEAEADDYIPEEMMETLSENVLTQMDREEDSEEEAPVEKTVEIMDDEPETVEEEKTVEIIDDEPVEQEAVEEEAHTEVAKKEKANLEEMAAKNTYVSKFEKLADTSKKEESSSKKKWKKKGEDDNYRVSNKELAEQLKEKLANKAAAAQPIYSEEELAEIEAEREAEEEREYDIDYDEYEDYYEDED